MDAFTDSLPRLPVTLDTVLHSDFWLSATMRCSYQCEFHNDKPRCADARYT